MSKSYEVLDELVPKTQELHRTIFDKGYEQGQRDILDKIRAEIEEQKENRCFDDMFAYITGLDDALEIIDKYKAESEE